VYDGECFVNQYLFADDKDILIKCLSSSGNCQAVISFTELEAALTRDFEDVGTASAAGRCLSILKGRSIRCVHLL